MAGSAAAKNDEPKQETWRDQLPVEFRADEYVTQFESVTDLVKDALNKNRLVGRKGVILPDEKATVEDVARFYNQLGRPADRFDGYKLDDFPDVKPPEDLPRDEAFEAAMLKELYDSGLTPKQAERVYKRYLEGATESYTTQINAIKERKEALAKKLGEEYGVARDRRLELANAAWEELGKQIGVKDEQGMEEWRGFLSTPLADGTTVGESWPLIKAFAYLGTLGGEAALVPPSVGSTRNFRMSRSEAAAKINQMMIEPDFRARYFDASNPGHAAAVAELQQLFKIQEGEE